MGIGEWFQNLKNDIDLINEHRNSAEYREEWYTDEQVVSAFIRTNWFQNERDEDLKNQVLYELTGKMAENFGEDISRTQLGILLDHVLEDVDRLQYPDSLRNETINRVPNATEKDMQVAQNYIGQVYAAKGMDSPTDLPGQETPDRGMVADVMTP